MASRHDPMTCHACHRPLVAGPRDALPYEAPGGGELSCLVKGLPTLKCSACGELHRSPVAVNLAQHLRGYVIEALELARDDARRGDPRQPALYDPRHVGVVTVELGAAPEPVPAPPSAAESSPALFEVKPLETLRSLAALDLTPDVSEALGDFIELARNPERVKEALGDHLHAEVERQYLSLSGKPGVGKTHLAEGVARELGCALYVINAGAITSSLHGETERNLTLLFEQVRERKGVLFIDEADTFADARLKASNGHEKALNHIRNALINELNRHRGVVVFATNLRDCYDPALARRMEDVHIPPPDAAQRRRLWKKVLGGARMSNAVDDVWIAQLDRRVERHEREHGDPDRPFTASDMNKVLVKAVARASRRCAGTVLVEREDVERGLIGRLEHLAVLRRKGVDEAGLARDVARCASGLLRALTERLRARLDTARRERPSVNEKAAKYQVSAETVMTSLDQDLAHVVEVLERVAPILGADDPREQLDQMRALFKVSLQRAA